ncbi:MAG TPA: hypothetical protein VGL37_03500 [Solirubrobacteraceae bacterium]|jgi:hypothetical protein
MSRLDSIPPDLSAVLSLLLRRGKRYAEVADMLGIQERAVHDRAHSALALLAPSQARGLSAPEREQLGEYLLGQQSTAGANQTRDFLAGSAAGRAWAEALVSELAPLAARSLPTIPAAGDTAPSTTRVGGERPARTTRKPAPSAAALTSAEASSPPPPSPGAPRQSSSRVGGAVILGALAAIVVVVVLLVVGVGGGGGSNGGSHGATQPSASTTTTHGGSTSTSTNAGKGTSSNTTTGTSTTSTSTTSTSTSGTSTGASSTSHGKALELTPPDPATSKAVGVAYVLTQKGRHAFYVFAKGLPTPPSGSFYAVWLEGAAGSTPDYPLGSLPAASTSGLVEGGGPLPSSAGDYSRIIVTTETSHHPSHPGPVALGGTFTLD